MANEYLLFPDIRLICGASKFASAFRDVEGRTPRNYRMEHNGARAL